MRATTLDFIPQNNKTISKFRLRHIAASRENVPTLPLLEPSRLTHSPLPPALDDLMPTLWTLSWTIVEENLAIICACLPMCRSILAALAAPFVDASSPNNNGNGHGHGHGNSNNNITTTMTTGAIDAHGGSACGSCVYAMQSLPKEIMLFGSQDSRDWRPYTGPNTRGDQPSHSAAQYRAEDSINQVCIHASKTRPPGLESGGKIWITTHYEISYESLSHNEY